MRASTSIAISVPLKADLSGWDMQGWELHSSEPIRPRMNWKLVIDTFLELYHFRYLHPGTVFPLFLDNIATYERMGSHMRWAAAKRSLTELEGQPKENWRIRDHAIVFYSLFPNTVLTYTQDHCGVFTSFPITPDELVMQFSVLVPPEEKAKKPESYWKANVDLFANAAGRGFRHRRDHPEELQERRQPPADLRQVREGAGLVPPGGRGGGRVTPF